VATQGIANVSVMGFNALLMKFAEKQGANVIVRGLRAVADFEYEYQMAGMNQQLNDRIETVFLMADVSLQPIASKLVKEIALFGGDITNFVTPTVRDEVAVRVGAIGQLGDY
jgi:pantetheine-phosphate adenylyltransferase